ncbi:MAG: LysM peptidoglycan-binding domain-containing protein [Planctomycetota bacterium]|jgi:nucleoid-associated protein YgaU
MRLREAQLLGILALIAVVIILLCLWGSEGDVKNVAGQEGAEAVGEGELSPGLAELVERLAQEGQAVEDEAEIVIEEVGVQIGGTAGLPEVQPTQESLIRKAIDETEPEGIPLVPPKKPDVQEAPSRGPQPHKALTHIVQKGETLSEISRAYYGTASKWRDIAKANGISDPGRLQVGMRLTIPAVTVVAAPSSRSALSATASDPRRTYTVKKGDNLYRIAQELYGDGMRWKDIQAENRQQLPDPSLLKPGMVLVVP